MAGIYLHIPFCKSKCNYCDFYSSINLSNIDKLVHSEISELFLRKQYLGNDLVNTIYFGGGTPSVLSISHIVDLLDSIRRNFTVSNECEITFEANPEDLNENYLSLLFQVGINRLSIGFQTFNDNILTFLNRRHNSSNLDNIIRNAKSIGFNNISVDLIFGIPGLDKEAYVYSLNKFINLDVQHISTYSLTIEKNTYFYKRLKDKKFSEISEDEMIWQFNHTINILEESGYNHDEVSNFAKEGYVSKHNSAYWSNSLYLGIGPSAHSYNGSSRQWNVSSIKNYCVKLEEFGDYFCIEYLTENDKYNEYILTGLRTSKGISASFVIENFCEKIVLYFKRELKGLINSEYIIQNQDNIFLTRKGILISDYIIRILFYS